MDKTKVGTVEQLRLRRRPYSRKQHVSEAFRNLLFKCTTVFFSMTKIETGQKIHQFGVGSYSWLFTHHLKNICMLHTIIVLFMTYVICSTCSLALN